VLWAKIRVDETRREARTTSQPDRLENVRGSFDGGIKQVPPDLRANFVLIRIQLARNTNLAIIAQG
jgi:hypothetical protein